MSQKRSLHEMTPEERQQRAEEQQQRDEERLLENEAQLKEQLENQMDEEIENHSKKVINGLWTFTRMPQIVEERYGGDEEKTIEEVFIPKLLEIREQELTADEYYPFTAIYNACVLDADHDDQATDEDLMLEFYEVFVDFVENAEVDEIMEILGFELPTLK